MIWRRKQMINVNQKRRLIKLRKMHLTTTNAYYFHDSNKLTQMLKKMYKIWKIANYYPIFINIDITKIYNYNPQDMYKLLIKIRKDKQLFCFLRK